MKKVFYGWYVCLGCALLFFCTSGLSINTFTIFQPFILKQNHFTNTQSSEIIMVRNLFILISMLLAGFYYKRLSLRRGFLLAGVMSVVGCLLFGFSDNILSYCLAAAATGSGYGLGTMIPVSMIMERWFIKQRTLAISLCSAVTGFSTLGIPSFLTHLIETRSLRFAFVTEALFMTVLILIGGFLIYSDPADKGLEPLSEPCTDNKTNPRSETVQKARLKKHDWILVFLMLLFLGAVTNVAYSHLSVFLNALNYAPQIIAIAITLSGISLILSKCLYGWLSERLKVTVRINLFGAVLISGILMLCFSRNCILLMFLGIIAFSMGLALTTVGMPEWAGDFSSPAAYDSTIRFFNIGYAGGSLLFSTLPGVLADCSAGSYIPAYIFFLFCSLFIVAYVQWVYHFRSV